MGIHNIMPKDAILDLFIILIMTEYPWVQAHFAFDNRDKDDNTSTLYLTMRIQNN